jgi:hypothetical protein
MMAYGAMHFAGKTGEEKMSKRLIGALASPNCAGRIQGPRWSSDMALHYNWCLSQPYPAVEAERGARTGFLRACRG